MIVNCARYKNVACELPMKSTIVFSCSFQFIQLESDENRNQCLNSASHS